MKKIATITEVYGPGYEGLVHINFEDLSRSAKIGIENFRRMLKAHKGTFHIDETGMEYFAPTQANDDDDMVLFDIGGMLFACCLAAGATTEEAIKANDFVEQQNSWLSYDEENSCYNFD